MQKYLKFIFLVILAFIWGSSFILIKEGLKGFSPTQLACIRLAFAGISLLPFTIKYLKQLKKSDATALIVVAIFGNGIPAFLFAYAQTKMGSATTGMLNSLVPMFTLITGFILFQIRPPKEKIVGVLLGLVGAILLIYSSKGDTDGDFLYGGLVVFATVCYAVSVNTLKVKLGHLPPLMTAAIPISIAMIPMLIYLIGFEPISGLGEMTLQTKKSLGAIAILGVGGTALAMIIFNKLIIMSNAIFASSVTYLIPVVALLWGFLAGESINMFHIFGLVTVLMAVYLINKKVKS